MHEKWVSAIDPFTRVDRCVLGRVDAAGGVTTLELTNDHKPELMAEVSARTLTGCSAWDYYHMHVKYQKILFAVLLIHFFLLMFYYDGVGHACAGGKRAHCTLCCWKQSAGVATSVAARQVCMYGGARLCKELAGLCFVVIWQEREGQCGCGPYHVDTLLPCTPMCINVCAYKCICACADVCCGTPC